MAGLQRDAVRVRRFRHVLPIGFVQHHPNPRRQRAEEALKGGAWGPSAGGIVRVGDEDDARRLVDALEHGVQIVPPILRRRHHQPAVGAHHGQGIDDEAVLIHDGLGARRKRHAGGEFQHIVGAVAKGDLRLRHVEAPRQGAFQLVAAAIRVTRQLRGGAFDGGANGGPGAARVLVAGELHDIFDAGFPRQLLNGFAGLIGAELGEALVDVGGDARHQITAFG